MSDMTPEERLMAFVEQEDTPRENLDVEDEAPVEEEIVDEETPQEESDGDEVVEEEAPSRILKLKYNGEEIEKPEAEVITLAQQGFDYTQKTQKLADERKQIEAQVQAVQAQEQMFQQRVQMQQVVLQDVAEVTAMDKQLAAFQNVNWNALSDSDPVEAQKLFFQFNQLQSTRAQKVNEIQAKQQQFAQFTEQNKARILAEANAKLTVELPQWSSPDTKRALMDTARDYGFNNAEISEIQDPRAIKLLHDAMQWRKLQASKPASDKKVASASPAVKAGAKDPKSVAQSSVKKVRDELRRTGKSDYAAKLIERTL